MKVRAMESQERGEILRKMTSSKARQGTISRVLWVSTPNRNVEMEISEILHEDGKNYGRT